MPKQFAVVSTLDDHNGNWVRVFSGENAETEANEYAAGYAKADGRMPQDTPIPDEDYLMNFCDFLGASEWLFVCEVTHD